MGRWWVSLAVSTASLIGLALILSIGSAQIMQVQQVVGWYAEGAGVDFAKGYVSQLGNVIRLPDGGRIEVLMSYGSALYPLSIYTLLELSNGSVAALGYNPTPKHWILFVLGSRAGLDLGIYPLSSTNRSAPVPATECGGGICIVAVVNTSSGYSVELINASPSAVARATLFSCSQGVAISNPAYYNSTLYVAVYCNNATYSIYGYAEVRGSTLELFNITNMPPLKHFVSALMLFEAGNISFVPASIHPLYGDIYITGGGLINAIYIHVAPSLNESKIFEFEKIGSYSVKGIPAYSAIYSGKLVMPLALKGSSGAALGEIDIDLATDLFSGYLYPASGLANLPQGLQLVDLKLVGANGTVAAYNMVMMNSTPATAIYSTYVALLKSPRTFGSTAFVYDDRYLGKAVLQLARNLSVSTSTPQVAQLSYVYLPKASVGEILLSPATSSGTSTATTSSPKPNPAALASLAPILAIALVLLLVLARRGGAASRLQRY